MLVYVITDSDRQVLGVVSEAARLQFGEADGLHVDTHVVNEMPLLLPQERPWVVYFNDANPDKPQVWPIKGTLPKENDGEAFTEGIEFCVHAMTAVDALAKVSQTIPLDRWNKLVKDWEAFQ